MSTAGGIEHLYISPMFRDSSDWLTAILGMAYNHQPVVDELPR